MNSYPVKKSVLREEARPVLKWAGGKGALLPQLSEKMPNKLKCGAIKRYIEPFVGGGAVFFDLINHFYIEDSFLFDVNPELIILYLVIKKDVHQLIEELYHIQDRYEKSLNKKEFYYQMREEFNTFDKDINTLFYHTSFIRRAALTVFLNKTCFNGLFRVNRKGLFNVPVGKYKNPKILDEQNLKAVSKALQRATILQADFSKVLDYVDRNTFVYYDPPYRPIDVSSFNTYAVGSFNDDEQKRLKVVFDQVNKIGALQMLSNSDPTNKKADPFFDDLYKDYHIYRIWAKRMINANPKDRDGVRELLITNYLL